jgi:hypothetical protein
VSSNFEFNIFFLLKFTQDFEATRLEWRICLELCRDFGSINISSSDQTCLYSVMVLAARGSSGGDTPGPTLGNQEGVRVILAQENFDETQERSYRYLE